MIFRARRRLVSSADLIMGCKTSLYKKQGAILAFTYKDVAHFSVGWRDVLTERNIFVDTKSYVCFLRKGAYLMISLRGDLHLRSNTGTILAR